MDVTGQYYLCGDKEVGSELRLRPDGTFEFTLVYGLADFWGSGTWKAVDGVVILNSSPAQRKDAYTLMKSKADKDGETRVKVMGESVNSNLRTPGGRPTEDQDLYFLVPGAKGVEGRTDSEGVAVFPASPEKRAVMFVVRVYGFQSPVFELAPDKHSFIFEVHWNALTGWVFKDERLRVDSGALIKKRSPDAPEMRYVK